MHHLNMTYNQFALTNEQIFEVILNKIYLTYCLLTIPTVVGILIFSSCDSNHCVLESPKRKHIGSVITLQQPKGYVPDLCSHQYFQ